MSRSMFVLTLLAVCICVEGRGWLPPGPTKPPRCPRVPCYPPKRIVNCYVDPCMFAKCESVPEATCCSDYCGGCNYFFTLNGKRVPGCSSQQDDSPPSCPQTPCLPPKRILNCFVDPCMFAKCESVPGATCCSDYCDGCNYFFTHNGKRVPGCTSQVEKCPKPCFHPDGCVKCLINPCDAPEATCCIPGSKCVANFCGGCNWDFFLDGEKIPGCSGPLPPSKSS